MLDAVPASPLESEPLVRLSDLDEYRSGLQRHLAGEWDDERWTAFRVRFGVYGQKQPGVQMVRIKIPGGTLSANWFRTLAKVNREFAVGDAHITTRQDVQIYSVPLSRSAQLLEALYSDGMTTREACGNTLRNVTACALAGACPRELVDAGRVAEQLAATWLRNPLVQHMPRKVKITVSGCATDCGHSSIHDLSFIAVEQGGVKGFRVTVGGGLGGTPRLASELVSFVTEDELSLVVEALTRLHHRYSDRRNRNASRIKFVLKRFGEEKFATLFAEEFARLKNLPQRPWEKLAWRDAQEAPVAKAPVGLVPAHDGSTAIVAEIPLGILSSDQLEKLAQLMDAVGIKEARATRDQNLVLLGVGADKLAQAVESVKALGFLVPASADEAPHVISCPGTTTCRIGITNSQSFARKVVADAQSDAHAKGVSVHISGCQNSCGLHHVADFGLHGMAKKVDGRAAPHYQIHIGGDAAEGRIGITGPIVAAKLADEAITVLRRAYAEGKQAGESVHAWAERLGKNGLEAVLKPLDDKKADALFVDWGDTDEFAGAPGTRGECAAPFAMDDLYVDMADDALITLDRALAAKLDDQARAAGEQALAHAARRLLHARALPVGEEAEIDVLAVQVQGGWADHSCIQADLANALASRGQDIDVFREAVATWLDAVRAAVEAPPAPVAAVGDISAILGGGE